MAGLFTVYKKELTDNLTSWRFIILFTLLLIATVVSLYGVSSNIRSAVTTDTRYIFINLYTVSGSNVPFSFMGFMEFLIPIVGIVLGLDAINSERSNGTLSRLVSQPIYRDAVINGKFVAGVVTIAIIVVSNVLLMSGLGLRMIGVPPASEEVARILFFMVTSVIYGAFWLGLAILFSILMKRVSQSALSSIAIWIFFFFFMSLLAYGLANWLAPAGDTLESQIHNITVQTNIMKISPIALYDESMSILLQPSARTMSQQLLYLQSGTSSYVVTPLTLGQSLLTVWPHLVVILVLTLVCFAISYIRFMREEIRAT